TDPHPHLCQGLPLLTHTHTHLHTLTHTHSLSLSLDICHTQIHTLSLSLSLSLSHTHIIYTHTHTLHIHTQRIQVLHTPSTTELLVLQSFIYAVKGFSSRHGSLCFPSVSWQPNPHIHILTVA